MIEEKGGWNRLRERGKEEGGQSIEREGGLGATCSVQGFFTSNKSN